MAVNYDIQASVVDIRKDTPKQADAFLIDTNVWFWTTYPTASQTANHYQTTNYPSYLNNALGAGANIYRANLSLAELSHTIESTEYKIYKSAVDMNAMLKEYRHNNDTERSRVVRQIEASWLQIESLGSPLELVIGESVARASLARLQNEKVDGYDLFILETMKAHGVTQIVTDDGDFVTVAGLQVFTANTNVIAAARAQGKLVNR